MELKWASDDPEHALRKILRYGAAYLFCRKHRNRLPLENRPLMDAKHVSLEVAAPAAYYSGRTPHATISRMRTSLAVLLRQRRFEGFTMSVNAFSFPALFHKVPLSKGSDVVRLCTTNPPGKEGLAISEAFEGLSPVA